MNFSNPRTSSSLAVDTVPAPVLSNRELFRLERDRQRGYSINTKQIILAFAVELVIIGLILTNNAVLAAQMPEASTLKIIQSMLFPIAMAMVELARVPLAVAVRTQNSWYIKFAAFFGVICAVAVTSVSLYLIGNSTFSPRLEKTQQNDSHLADLIAQKKTFDSQVGAAKGTLDQKIAERDKTAQSIQALNLQLNAQQAQNCIPLTVTRPDGTTTTQNSCRANPVIAVLRAEIATLRPKLAEAEAAAREAEINHNKLRDDRSLDEEIKKARSESRTSIYDSQLHSYAAMIFGKDPKDISEGEVKTLQGYLIGIPAIAAAFSSTLIAMTAVRRVRNPPTAPATISDEAAAYLFGPLVDAIRQEAAEAVAEATAAVRPKNLKPPPTTTA